MALINLRILLPDGFIATCPAEASDRAPWRLCIDVANVGVFEEVADDLFECLRAIARRLNDHGARICCNGMLRDVRPSPMAREASGARWLYQFQIGQPADPRSIVPLFGEAPCESTVLPDEQDVFYEQWISSVGRT